MTMKRPLIAAFAILACLMFARATGAGTPYPASAGGVIDPACTSSSPCIEYDNNGTGSGVKGLSLAGNGLIGVTKQPSTSTANGKAGIFGNDLSTSGVWDAGVQAKSVRGFGVLATSTSGNALRGQSSTGTGVWGQSTSALGVFGLSSSDVGVYGESLGEQPAVKAHNNGLGVGLQSDGYTGAELIGNGVGAIVRSQVGTTNYPLILTDLSHNDLFFVNGNGDVFYHGTLNTFAIAPKGNVATAYTSKAASPMVEDTGSGQLINGVALVALDAAFSQTIDPRTSYHVLLTPDGDTRGLFVARKTPTGFVVREVEGGRSSVTFDYHIYAPARGHAGERMVVMTRAAAAALMPHVRSLAVPMPPHRP